MPTIGHATIHRAGPGADWQAGVIYDEPVAEAAATAWVADKEGAFCHVVGFAMDREDEAAAPAAVTNALNGFDLP